jgi:hypothetical protein
LTDVLSSVQVGVTATVALGTHEVVAVACALATAGRTAVTRLKRVNFFNTNPGLLCLVDDELLQLVEMPRVDTTPVAFLSDTFQILDRSSVEVST